MRCQLWKLSIYVNMALVKIELTKTNERPPSQAVFLFSWLKKVVTKCHEMSVVETEYIC